MNFKKFFEKISPQGKLLTSDPPIQELDKRLHCHFKNLFLLQQALTHKSFVNENPTLGLKDNERLEFLGDAVLELIISDRLMKEFPEISEGELSKLRAMLVSEQGLTRVAQTYQLGDFLFLGKGEKQSGGQQKPSLLSNAYEAVIGGLYLDRGYQHTQRMVEKHFFVLLKEAHHKGFQKDYKTQLQELVQNQFGQSPKYILLNTSGPDHRKTFEVSLQVNDSVFGMGQGRNKKEAEQEAARQALERLQGGPCKTP